MNLDRTFCTGLRCSRREACDHWTGNLYRYIRALPEKDRKWLEGIPISVAQFADHAGYCEKYSPIQNPGPPEVA